MRKLVHRIAAIALFGAAGLTVLGSTALARNVDVGNLGSDSVSVLDTRTNTAVATIPVGDGPSAIAITPDGTRAYVVNSNSDSVSVIDLATNSTVGAPIPVGDGPSAIAITPDGTRAYLAIRNTNRVSMIDTRTNTVVGPAGRCRQPSPGDRDNTEWHQGVRVKRPPRPHHVRDRNEHKHDRRAADPDREQAGRQRDHSGRRPCLHPQVFGEQRRRARSEGQHGGRIDPGGRRAGSGRDHA